MSQYSEQVKSNSVIDQLNRRLEALSVTDALTGIYNRAGCESVMYPALSQNQLNNGRSVFMLADVDHLKYINDTFGHAMGDIALKDTGTKLTMIFSHNDILGRISGDEFQAFLCLDHMISQEDAMDIITSKAESLIETLTETYINDTRSIKITASVGIAVYPYHGTTYKELNHFAETALFSAKQSGKNEFRIYSHGIMDRPIATEY